VGGGGQLAPSASPETHTQKEKTADAQKCFCGKPLLLNPAAFVHVEEEEEEKEEEKEEEVSA